MSRREVSCWLPPLLCCPHSTSPLLPLASASLCGESEAAKNQLSPKNQWVVCCQLSSLNQLLTGQTSSGITWFGQQGEKKMILWYLCNVLISAEFGVVLSLIYSTLLFQISPFRYKSSVFMPTERRKISPNLPTISKILKSNYKAIHAVVSEMQRSLRQFSNVFFATAHRFFFFLCEPLLLELPFSGPVHSVLYGWNLRFLLQAPAPAPLEAQLAVQDIPSSHSHSKLLRE